MNKKRYSTLLLLALILLAHPAIFAQDVPAEAARIDHLLSSLPAHSADDAEKLFAEAMSLSDEGLASLIATVRPSGHEEGVASRFAVSLLTRQQSTDAQKRRIEKAFLNGLAHASNEEIKAYFIDNLKIVGSDASVAALASLIGNKGLSDQAISALMSINTSSARAALLDALKSGEYAPETQARLINSLGELGDVNARESIQRFAASENVLIRKNALWSLALLADPASYDVLLQQASAAKFAADPSDAVPAFLEYLRVLHEKGNNAIAMKGSEAALAGMLSPEQQHFRLAALKVLTHVSPETATKVLIKELSRFDAEYQKEVIKVAALTGANDDARKAWTRAYRKRSGQQADILRMLAQTNRTDAFVESTLLKALKSKSMAVRTVAAEEIAYSRNPAFQPYLTDYLLRSTSPEDILAAKNALLRVMDANAAAGLAAKLAEANPAVQVAIIEIAGARRVNDSFNDILESTSSPDERVRTAAFAALSNVSSATNVPALIALLERTDDAQNTQRVQQALIESMDDGSVAAVNAAFEKNREKVLPLLPYIRDPEALNKVISAFQHGSPSEKEAAFNAMVNWQDEKAARTLISICKDPELDQYHKKAFDAFLTQVSASSWPDDEKLLMYDQAMSAASDTKQKNAVIRAAGNLHTFLALVFVSKYLDDEALNRAASRSVMQIALPTSDGRPGLTGVFVRNTLQKILDKLEGQDSQYEVIDIQTYLASMPYTKGFEPIFNGKDLSGWQGLVENPIARAKMSREELSKKQLEANRKAWESWSVKDGAIWFSGEGSNLCTIRKYKDFEMLVDWKISRNGDSGIYLRGSPQVQIWDPTGKEEAARVGSGGLYNNQQHRSTPLVVADNPVGEWNTFRIRMVGDRVTVYLNGVLVVDSTVMENYWDRNLPIFPEEAIELQAHGNELAFRNIFVKELGNGPYELTEEERENGFQLLFNGKNLDGWVGNKTEYVVEDNAIAIYPQAKGHGNLYTAGEYADFVFRFEFQLTPGANNGLGIHAPLEGDAAYVGKEIQILDNTAPVYAHLQPYQYHGSVYGIIPAKRGFLKPVGEWNQEEVYVKGNKIRVTLNGTVIVDGDLARATRRGTMDHKEHPGLQRHRGHIGFLGHGTIVRFRNIRIRDLSAGQ